MIVRDWNSVIYRIVSIEEWRQAEDKAGPNSAFARSIRFSDICGYASIVAYLEYLNDELG